MRYIVLSPFLSKPLEKMMISVLIADDQSLVRNLLQRLLERAGDIQIVAIAFDEQEAIEQVVLHCPDVAVMDVSMPTLNGIAATSKSARVVPSFLDMRQCALVIRLNRVIILSPIINLTGDTHSKAQAQNEQPVEPIRPPRDRHDYPVRLARVRP